MKQEQQGAPQYASEQEETNFPTPEELLKKMDESPLMNLEELIYSLQKPGHVHSACLENN